MCILLYINNDNNDTKIMIWWHVDMHKGTLSDNTSRINSNNKEYMAILIIIVITCSSMYTFSHNNITEKPVENNDKCVICVKASWYLSCSRGGSLAAKWWLGCIMSVAGHTRDNMTRPSHCVPCKDYWCSGTCWIFQQAKNQYLNQCWFNLLRHIYGAIRYVKAVTGNVDSNHG